MRNAIRIAIGSAALTAGLAFAGASRADAQVSFQGSFPLPHGRISIAIGDPAFRVGTYVPRGYRVDSRPGYGYGFGYRDRWIPVRRFGSQWIVCESPYGAGEVYRDDAYADDVYAAPSYFQENYYDRGYGYRGYQRYSRPGCDRRFNGDDRWNNRRFNGNDRRNNREHDGRRDGRGDWRH